MLQGSLDNFALDEVLGLLSGTKKTGRLEIHGDRGTGSLMFAIGKLVGAEANHTPNGDGTEDIMFELLRFKDGTFTFHNENITDSKDAKDLSAVLTSAELRLKDWRAIESVVPSLNHVVSPVPELPADEVKIARAEWAALNVIGSGCPVSLICEELSLGEIEGSRRIKDLAARKLVNIGEPLGSASANEYEYTESAPEETSAMSYGETETETETETEFEPYRSFEEEVAEPTVEEESPATPFTSNSGLDINESESVNPIDQMATSSEDFSSPFDSVAIEDEMPELPPTPEDDNDSIPSISDLQAQILEEDDELPSSKGSLLDRYLKNDE